MIRTKSACCLVVLLALAPVAGRAASAPESQSADLDQLIGDARRMNPDVAVATLEADAAEAKIEGAGSLPDPKIQWQVQNWPRNQPGALPRSPFLGDNMFTVVQMFPLWGKRGLQQEIAEAGAREAQLLRREVENEVVARVKIAHAEYHSAHLASDLQRALRGRMDVLARLAEARYAQGVGKQEDATRARVEMTRLETEIARTDATRYQARVAINRLLDRDRESPLTETPARRPIPGADEIDVAALSARAERGNPDLLAKDASIEGADKETRLAEKDWYPDVEVGFGPETMGSQFTGYNMTLSVSVPLQWGLHESKVSTAKARAQASRARRKVTLRDIDKDLSDAWSDLKSQQAVEKLLREVQLPQARIGFESVANGYSLGRTNFVDVLSAEQQLWQTEIELIKVEFDQQIRLAQMEKLVGGEL